MCDHMVNELKFAITCGPSSKRFISTSGPIETANNNLIPLALSPIAPSTRLSLADVQQIVNLRDDLTKKLLIPYFEQAEQASQQQQQQQQQQKREKEKNDACVMCKEHKQIVNSNGPSRAESAWVYANSTDKKASKPQPNIPPTTEAISRTKHLQVRPVQKHSFEESYERSAKKDKRLAKASKQQQHQQPFASYTSTTHINRHEDYDSTNVKDTTNNNINTKNQSNTKSLDIQKIPIQIELGGKSSRGTEASRDDSNHDEQQINFETYISKSNIVNFV